MYNIMYLMMQCGHRLGSNMLQTSVTQWPVEFQPSVRAVLSVLRLFNVHTKRYISFSGFEGPSPLLLPPLILYRSMVSIAA